MVIKFKFYCDKNRHLVCVPYSIDALHKMAKKLNIKKIWFHNHNNKAHYDIPKKRIDEIMSKCEVVDSCMIINIIKGHYHIVYVTNEITDDIDFYIEKSDG